MKINYSKAPVKEAVLDVRPIFDGDISLEDIQKYITNLPKKYKNSEPKEVNEFVAEIRSGKTISGNKHIGFVVKSEDNQMIRATLNNFVFVKFPRYYDGDTFFEEFQKAWEPYAATMSVTRIVRVGLRFLNVLDFGIKDISEISKYIKFTPDAHPLDELEPDVFAVFTGCKVKDSDCNVSIRIEVEKREDSYYIKFDIDAFKFTQPDHLISENDLRSIYDDLRTLKNKVFEGNLTDAAKERFK